MVTLGFVASCTGRGSVEQWCIVFGKRSGWTPSTSTVTGKMKPLPNWSPMRGKYLSLPVYDFMIYTLTSTNSLFWSARVGVLNYPGDIHDYVTSGQVQIIKKDISHLSKNGTINLADGTSYQT